MNILIRLYKIFRANFYYYYYKIYPEKNPIETDYEMLSTEQIEALEEIKRNQDNYTAKELFYAQLQVFSPEQNWNRLMNDYGVYKQFFGGGKR